MRILNKIFLIVLLVTISSISCSKKNIRLIDADTFKGKMYISSGQDTHKTLFYLKYSQDHVTITLLSQFGETIYAAGYTKNDDTVKVATSSVELDSTSIHNAMRLFHTILVERLYEVPVQSDDGRVEFEDRDEDGFPKIWIITTSMFRVKVIFNAD